MVIFVDNVDQLSPSYQAQIFMLAQRVTRLIGSVTVVALREESYYTASVQKTFTAYTNRKFHIASPQCRKLIVNRLRFARHYLKDAQGALPYEKQRSRIEQRLRENRERFAEETVLEVAPEEEGILLRQEPEDASDGPEVGEGRP